MKLFWLTCTVCGAKTTLSWRERWLCPKDPTHRVRVKE